MMKLGLAHKVLFVVSVPVIFQLAFLSYLTGYLRELDSNQEREREATSVLLLRDRLNVADTQRKLLYGLYRATQDEAYQDKYAENDKEIKKAYREIYLLWRNDPKKKRLLETSWRANLMISRMGWMLMNGERKSTLSGLFGGTTDVQMFRAALDMGQDSPIDMMFARNVRDQTTAEQMVEQSQKSVKLALLIGLIVSVIISIASGLFFSLSISERLKRVLRNIKSMEQRNRLMQPAGGSDEISMLDKAILDTAKKIQDAEDFQAQTARIVAEELERPLETVSSAFSELRKSGFENLSEKGEDRLQHASREIGRLRTLVGDLVVLDSIRAAGYDLKTQEMDLGKTAREAAEIVREFAQSKRVQLSCQATTAMVVGDPDRLVQVAVNLLSNAIKFSPPNSQVVITTTQEGGFGRLAVQDFGQGIPDEFQNKIFSRFEQARETDATEKNGSGLGLAICKKLVEAQSGQMNFSSKAGVGSTFWFTVPIAGAENSPAPSVSNTAVIAPAGANQEWKPTLHLKGLALIAMPLIVQVATIGVLWLVMTSVSQNLSEFTRTRKIANIHTHIINHVTRGVYYSMIYNLLQEPPIKDTVEEEQAAIQASLDQLDQITKDNKELDEQAGNLREIVSEIIKIQSDIMSAEQDASLDKWFGPTSAAKTEKLLERLEKPLHDVIQSEAEQIQGRPLASHEMRSKIEFVLLSSALLTALVSAGLGLFIVRKLNRRVQRVVANTVRLSNRESLEPPMSGTDELAFVDRSFYEAANKLLELERFKQEMISVTSHELRTPLTSLLAVSDLMGAGVFGTVTEYGNNLLKIARRNISELVSMITNLLDLEKIQSGKLLISKKSVPVDSILESALANVEELAEDRHIELRARNSGLTVNADSQRLIQALTAVLTEMTERAPEASVIRLDSVDEAAGVKLYVVCPGQNTVAAAGDESDQQMARGRLALDLTRAITQQHGGEVQIESAVDHRAVIINLPRIA